MKRTSKTSRADFFGTVYLNRTDYTEKVSVSLGRYSVSRGFDTALKKLQGLYPCGWLYGVTTVSDKGVK